MLLSTGSVLQPIRVEGRAMEPTLSEGDSLGIRRNDVRQQ